MQHTGPLQNKPRCVGEGVWLAIVNSHCYRCPLRRCIRRHVWEVQTYNQKMLIDESHLCPLLVCLCWFSLLSLIFLPLVAGPRLDRPDLSLSRWQLPSALTDWVSWLEQWDLARYVCTSIRGMAITIVTEMVNKRLTISHTVSNNVIGNFNCWAGLPVS